MKSLLPKNRPIRWTQGDIVIEMAYDRMGRRIVYHETRNDANYINAKFVYDGHLCIQRLYGGSNGVYQSFVWDPTEPIATRPLCMQVPSWGSTVFYMHDGNKNVSDVIYYAVANGIAAHYDYAPFGAVTRTARDTRMTGRDFIGENPFRFSSEYHDNTLGLVYYNYRHYNPLDGRWCGRDPIGEIELFVMCFNNPVQYYDWMGTTPQVIGIFFPNGTYSDNEHFKKIASNNGRNSAISVNTGKELLQLLGRLMKSSDDCCLKILTFAGHGWAYNEEFPEVRGNGLPGATENSDGLYLFKKDAESKTLDELQKEVDVGNIKFCKGCRIQIYACRISDEFSNRLAKISGCVVVAARGSCSAIDNETWSSGAATWDERIKSTNLDFSASLPHKHLSTDTLGPIYKPQFK